jgi:3-mercaptopyruvate sulfurtransferase SseA
VALRLRHVGVVRVRPLAGGFEAWRAAGFPVEPLPPAPAATPPVAGVTDAGARA